LSVGYLPANKDGLGQTPEATLRSAVLQMDA